MLYSLLEIIMEIKNVTSTVNGKLQTKMEDKVSETSFKEAVFNSNQPLNIQEDELDFKKINGMTIGEIEAFYEDKRTSELLKTLKLSTLFSNNINMNEAMFNRVLSQGSLEDSQSFLYNMAFNRNSYLFNANNHASSVRKNIIDQLSGEVKIEQIRLEKEFQSTMIQFDVAQHMSDMMNFSKNERDRNKENSDMSFMYDNMYFQYYDLFDEYRSTQTKNHELLTQKLTNNRLNGLNL